LQELLLLLLLLLLLALHPQLQVRQLLQELLAHVQSF
jgi:hypothetical protein